MIICFQLGHVVASHHGHSPNIWRIPKIQRYFWKLLLSLELICAFVPVCRKELAVCQEVAALNNVNGQSESPSHFVKCFCLASSNVLELPSSFRVL